MESQQHGEHEPQESGREMAERLLGETLARLGFEETELMAELRGITAEAIKQDDPLTALTAYARYQEVGQEHIETTAPNDAHARLALNIACARLLAIRGERERFFSAIEDCVMHATLERRDDIADELNFFLT